MHWTQLLAYRRTEHGGRNVRIDDDLSCVGCGYNLRGMLASGKCPECGGNVRDSMFVLPKRELVARSIRAIGKSYFTQFVMLMGCINSATGWPLLVATCIIAIGSVWRCVCAWQLHYQGSLRHLAGVGPRLSILWWAIAIDTAISCMLGLATIAQVNIAAFQTPKATNVIEMMHALRFASALASAAACGWFGLSLAGMLGYDWMRWEFRGQIMTVLIGALVLAIAVLTYLAIPIAGMTLGLLTAMLLCGTFLVTPITLIHLANAAEQQTDAWDEA